MNPIIYLQSIKVDDNDAPLLNELPDVTIGTDPWKCSGKLVLPDPVLTDKCSMYTVKWIVNYGNVQDSIISDLQKGVTVVTAKVSDMCGNIARKSFNVTVIDATPPIAIAKPTQVGSQPVVPGSGSTSEEDAGELYFFLQPRQAGQSIQLVRVSGVCVFSPANCPPMEEIKVPFPFNFTISPLSWSPDGKLAAFSYSDNSNGTPTKMWLFDPTGNLWTSVAEFPYIDPPFWSRDSKWIAFRVQDGVGGEDVYIVKRDGRELKSVSPQLPVEGQPYVLDGWYTESVIMRSART